MLTPCGVARNNLRVVYNRLAENETKKDFAVCVKGLDFPQDDLSVRFPDSFHSFANPSAGGGEKMS